MIGFIRGFKGTAARRQDGATFRTLSQIGLWPSVSKKHGGIMMKPNTDKIDDATLALLYLVVCERDEEFGGVRAWKGFDWETMNRLHAKGLISDPVGKQKSINLSEEGYQKSRALFEKLFCVDE
jgi:hypothetical protein